MCGFRRTGPRRCGGAHAASSPRSLVFLARDSRDGSLVAVKRINLCHNIYGVRGPQEVVTPASLAPCGDLRQVTSARALQVPLTAIREVKILRHYKHPNLVELRDIRTPGGTRAAS